MTDVIGPRHVAVHAIQRCRLRRAQIGPAILDLVPVERGYPPVGLDRGAKRRDPVGRRHRCHKVLKPILDPLDRTADDPRSRRDQDRVGRDALLHPERSP